MFSIAIAIVAGVIFDFLVRKKILPENVNAVDIPENFNFFEEARKSLSRNKYDFSFFKEMAYSGIIKV